MYSCLLYSRTSLYFTGEAEVWLFSSYHYLQLSLLTSSFSGFIILTSCQISRYCKRKRRVVGAPYREAPALLDLDYSPRDQMTHHSASRSKLPSLPQSPDEVRNTPGVSLFVHHQAGAASLNQGAAQASASQTLNAYEMSVRAKEGTASGASSNDQEIDLADRGEPVKSSISPMVYDPLCNPML